MKHIGQRGQFEMVVDGETDLIEDEMVVDDGDGG